MEGSAPPRLPGARGYAVERKAEAEGIGMFDNLRVALKSRRHHRSPYGSLSMKAWEVREATGLDGLVLNASRPEPKPGHGQIVVRVRAASLNYRDQGVIKGIYGYTKFPVIPLSDGAGEVVEVGPGITQFKPGDRVAGTFFQNWTGGRMPRDAAHNSLGGMVDGMLTEYALLEVGAIKIPDHLSFEEAATLPCAALTAWNALIETGRIKAGETVALLGTGGVSCFGLAFAKMHGAYVS